MKQSIKQSGIKSIFYECKQVTETNNVQSMCEVISDSLGLPKRGYTKADEILDYVINLAKEETIVFVLDEYPYLRENAKGLDSIIQTIEKIGKYYYGDPATRTNGEFDVVTSDEKGYVFFEVKFKKKKISKEVIEAEISQFKATGLNCYIYVFFSRSGFTEKETKENKYIELDRMY